MISQKRSIRISEELCDFLCARELDTDESLEVLNAVTLAICIQCEDPHKRAEEFSEILMLVVDEAVKRGLKGVLDEGETEN